MFNEKDILARLQNGEKAEDIANEFAKIINSANSTYRDQKRKEAEEAEKIAAAQAKQIEEAKTKELELILAEFHRWLKQYYDVSVEVCDEIDADVIYDIIDICRSSAKSLRMVAPLFSDRKNKADKVIDNWLKSMNW